MTNATPVGADPAFKDALHLAERAAKGSAPVIITGPTGSGKSLLARFTHEARPTSDGPFLEWYAGATSASLFESELFGVATGAATGVAERPGVFEKAGGGTLCMVSLELLSSAQQAALLRVVDERYFSRIGTTRILPNRAMTIAAFSEPPEKLVEEGRLRSDLLYRLDVIRIVLPSLADRRDDIPRLAVHCLKEACQKLKRKVPEISRELMDALSSAPWPGNVRQLSQRMMELALVGSEVLTTEDLPANFWNAVSNLEAASERRMTLKELRGAYIKFVLRRTGGNKTRAARWLGISRKALWEHLRRSPV